MTFNIEYGGEEVDFGSVIRAIEKSRADVVGIEEAWGNTERIARRLGWPFYDPRLQIVSRYPLLAPPGGDRVFTYVEVGPGRVIALGNVHLPSSPYGPFKVRDGWGRERVLGLERRVRLPSIRPFADQLSGTAGKGIPSFLVGDFNSPSHLDWTAETVGIRKHMKYTVEWPVSAALANAGFQDSYRKAHPDPVAEPGLTWPAARPFVEGYNPGLNGAPPDRIDFVYVAGPATTRDSVVLGERGAPGASLSVAPWPTDHRAVLSTFGVTPGVPPPLIAVEQRLVTRGDKVRLRFRSPAGGADLIAIVAHGDPVERAIATRPAGDNSANAGALTFATNGWKPGLYDAVMVGANGSEYPRASFWLLGKETNPRLRVSRRVYDRGGPIRLRWMAAPGNRWDWIGIYPRGSDPHVASFLLWLYTGATIAGKAALGEEANGPWPLPPGRYSAYLLEDDSYARLATARFSVR